MFSPKEFLYNSTRDDTPHSLSSYSSSFCKPIGPRIASHPSSIQIDPHNGLVRSMIMKYHSTINQIAAMQ